MTQQQIIREFERFSKAEKSVVIRELLQIFEKDLSDDDNHESEAKTFTINALRLCPHRELDFDNIGKLLEEIEGAFHK